MSSVRISQHSRVAAAPQSSGGETGKTEAPSGVAAFAAALGAAGLIQTGPGTATLFDAKANVPADGTNPTRKRTGSEGKSGDAAAILAAQASLLGVAGQVPLPSHDAIDASGVSAMVLGADLETPVMAGAGQPNVNFGSPSIAPADASATSLSHPSDTSIVAAWGNLADDTPAADVATAGPMPGDAAVDLSGVLPTLRPQLPSASSMSLWPAQPAPTETAQAIPPAAASEPGAGSGDAASGGQSRERFAPVAGAFDGARAAEAVALGAPSEPAALANAPAAAAAPAAGVEAAATVASQVAGHVVRLVSSSSREMVMRLHPPELGEVTVRVVVNGRDVSAWFASPQPHVQTAIADGIGQLQAGLDNAGYHLNGAWVGAGASGRRQPAGNPPPAAQMPVAAGGLDTGMTAASRPSASGLNIYV